LGTFFTNTPLRNQNETPLPLKSSIINLSSFIVTLVLILHVASQAAKSNQVLFMMLGGWLLLYLLYPCLARKKSLEALCKVLTMQ
jgi:hypothetical protein